VKNTVQLNSIPARSAGSDAGCAGDSKVPDSRKLRLAAFGAIVGYVLVIFREIFDRLPCPDSLPET
jgi:hypothetical protein